MSTSGGGTLNAVLYVVVLGLAVPIGLDLAPGRRLSPRAVWAAAGLWLLVAVPSVLQFAWPGLLTALRRDPDLIRHHHQYWRVLSSVLVQDGGVPGTVFNLVILAVVALVAAQAWGPVRLFAVFASAHLVFNLAVTFLSSDLGAGNSGATFGLATSLVGLGLLTRPTREVLLRGGGVLVAAIVLLVIGDAHGIPMVGGILIGLLLARAAPNRPPRAHRADSVADS